MTDENVTLTSNQPTPKNPITIREDICIGCNQCVEACMPDVFAPNPEKGGPPLVLYPDECFYCGVCIEMCPVRFEGCMELTYPLMQKARWKRKETGEHFRVGMKDPPAPVERPPAGGWDYKNYYNFRNRKAVELPKPRQLSKEE